MIEVRIHGRGGQGAVVASKVLAAAIFEEGKFVQCFPAFGVERRGAPVAAYLRIDDRFIHLRTGITHPDHIVLLDARLLAVATVTEGLKPGGVVLINSPGSPGDFPDLRGYVVYTVDANRIAVAHGLGSRNAPIVNTVMSGAFLKVSGLARLQSLAAAIRAEVPVGAEANVEASGEAYRELQASVPGAVAGGGDG